MEHKQDNYISLSQLAKLFLINKSMVHYWNKQGIIKHEQVVGKMFLFNKKETVSKVKEILLMKQKGFSNEEIKNKLR